jgi:hypothetical protein
VPFRARTLTLCLLALTAGACDRSDEHADCVGPGDPAAAPGSRRGACPPSEFREEDYRTREVGGVVRRGEDAVAGATVRVDPSTASGREAEVASTVTDASGSFGGLRTVGLRYDLSVDFGRGPSGSDEVMIFRDLAGRRVEPSIEGPRTFGRSWTSRVRVSLDRAVPGDHALAFFVTGAPLYDVQPGAGDELTVLARDYTSPGTLHVVEYEAAGGLETAIAYGKADLLAVAGGTQLVAVGLAPIELVAEPKFVVYGPPGFTAKAIEIRAAYSRTSGAPLASIPVGTSRPLHLPPNAPFTYRVVATDGAVTSDTGEVGFDILEPSTTIVVRAPPRIVSPAEGEARAVGEALLVDGEGVFEHLLAPQAGGPTMRIVTAQRATAVPDPTRVGAPAAAGAYTWTVRAYPAARFAEELGGIDARRYRPMITSAPRTIVLR